MAALKRSASNWASGPQSGFIRLASAIAVEVIAAWLLITSLIPALSAGVLPAITGGLFEMLPWVLRSGMWTMLARPLLTFARHALSLAVICTAAWSATAPRPKGPVVLMVLTGIWALMEVGTYLISLESASALLAFALSLIAGKTAESQLHEAE